MTSQLTYQASQAHLQDLRRYRAEHPDQKSTARRRFATLLRKPASA